MRWPPRTITWACDSFRSRGITEKLLPDYLRSPLVACVGGSWLAGTGAIRAKDWTGVEKNAAGASAIVRQCRGK